MRNSHKPVALEAEGLPMSPVKQLIINADDFGLHESINRGIIASHRDGCVTSTTIMAGGPAFQHAVSLVRTCPDLSVGVHLTLVGMRPAAQGDVHTLVDREGNLLPDYTAFARAYLRGAISRQHIERELSCQMQKVAGSGIPISHIDSHQHLHVMPGLSEIVIRVAREFRVTKVRIPAERLLFFPAARAQAGRVAARTMVAVCSLWARRRYSAAEMIYTRNFYGMLSGGRMKEKELIHVIQQLPPGTSELMVHPGWDNEALNEKFGWGYHWQEELVALQSPDVRKLIEANHINLINYRDLSGEKI
jgi:hopanoid biosynthesis associated protein HpnK